MHFFFVPKLLSFYKTYLYVCYIQIFEGYKNSPLLSEAKVVVTFVQVSIMIIFSFLNHFLLIYGLNVLLLTCLMQFLFKLVLSK